MEEVEEGEAEEEEEEIEGIGVTEVIEEIEGIVEAIEEAEEEDKIEVKEEGEIAIMMILTKRKYTWIKILEKSQLISFSANSSSFNKKKV